MKAALWSLAAAAGALLAALWLVAELEQIARTNEGWCE